MILGREFCLVMDCLFFLKDNIKGNFVEFIIFYVFFNMLVKKCIVKFMQLNKFYYRMFYCCFWCVVYSFCFSFFVDDSYCYKKMFVSIII